MGFFLFGVLGTVIPFKLAQYILKRLYSPDVTGLPVPTSISFIAYGTALAVATVAVYFSYGAIIKDREPSDRKDGLDHEEDLPY